MYEGIYIKDLIVIDLRFPTSLQHDGSDAMVSTHLLCRAVL